ncbi:hypothetical protein ScPMuIL_008200 [Solemya velum]
MDGPIHGKVLDFSRRKFPTGSFGLAMIATITGLIKIVMGEKFLKKFAIGTFVLIRNGTRTDEGVRLKDGVAMVFKTKMCNINDEAEQEYNNPDVVDVETAISSPKKRRCTVVGKLQKIGECVSTSTTTMRTLWIGQGAQSISLKLWGENTGIPILKTDTEAVDETQEMTAEVEGIDCEDEAPSILMHDKVYQCPQALLEKEFPGGLYVSKTVRVRVVGTQIIEM